MTPGSRRTRRTNLTHLLYVSATTALVGFWLLVLGLSTGAERAAAATQQTTEPQSESDDRFGAVLEVIEQSTFVAADGTMQLEVAIEPPELAARFRSEYSLATTVYGLLDTEAAVDEPLSQPINRTLAVTLDELSSTGPGRYRLEVPVRSGSQFDDRERVLLPTPGVYPVAIELRSPDGPVATTRTHLIRLPQVTSEDDPVETLLPVAIVLNVSTAEGLTLQDVQQLLIDHPGIPMTVVLQEGVENQLRTNPELAAGFVAALGGRPVLAVPPIDLDPSALAEIGQGELYVSSTSGARSDLEKLGLTVADDMTLLDSPITEAGLAVLEDLSLRSVLDTNERSAANGRVRSDDHRLQIIRIDRELSRILGGGTDGPHRANRVLAKLILRGMVDDAPVVLGGSSLGVDPGASIDAFLRALTQPGAPRPVLVSEITSGPWIRLAERPQQDLLPVTEALVAVQAKLATYEGFFSGGGNTPQYYRRQILSSLARQRNPEDRARALVLLDSQLDDDLSVIELHDGQPVTLAARAAPIPIIVENTGGGPREVMLRFHSDKVAALEDRQVVTIQPGTSAIDVELETRSLGISPLEVSVWTPDGGILLANTRFEIRSTAVPGLGLLVSVGAVGLLGAWWILDARRRRTEMMTEVSRGSV